MEISDLTSYRFWQSHQGHVMENLRDEKALAEARFIRPWLKDQQIISDHILFATSGSTGGSKWVALSRTALLASARAVNKHLNAGSEDRWLLAIPSFHVGGMGILARAYLASSDVVELEGKWDAYRYHDLAERERATLSSLVPTQLVDIVRLGLRSPASMRAVLIGGGHLDDMTYQQAIELGWPVMETYGMTETCSQVATCELGSRELKILPAWQADVWREGHVLALRGDPLLSGYVSCADGRCEFTRCLNQGWFVTGDVVDLQEDVLVVKGRSDRCVKVLGELVNLAEVEDGLLVRGKFTADIAIAAILDERVGYRLVLCSDHEGGLNELMTLHNAKCNPLHRIDSVVVLEGLPRSPLGKILYSDLREIVECM